MFARAVFMVLAGISVCAAAEGEWRLKLQTGETVLTVRPDGSDAQATIEKQTAEKQTMGGVLSPDGKAIARTEVRRPEASDAHPSLFVTDANDLKKFRFVDFEGDQPAWSPDSKSVVYRSATGVTQIRHASVLDSGSGCIRVACSESTQLSNALRGAYSPRALANGHYAWLEWNSVHGKLRHSDLVIYDGKTTRKLVDDQYIADYAVSPDSKTIAYGTVGSLVFIQVQSGEKTTVPYETIDKKLYAHAATGITWRPDQAAIACRIGFLGGRLTGTTVFGDSQIFVLPRHGQATWFMLDDRLGAAHKIEQIRWERASAP